MIRGIILDLDGTVYRGDHEIDGAGAFCAKMKSNGVRCVFVTNRSNRTPDEIDTQLHDYGIECCVEDILTTSLAAAKHVGSGSAYMVGEDGLRLALENQGITITDNRPDYVIVGWDRSVTFEKLKIATRLIHEGATFIATNPDPRLTTHEGIFPGTGAIVAAVKTAAKQDPLVIGKPEPLLFNEAIVMLGVDRTHVIAVGDSLDTDVAAGCKAGIRTALMLTGHSCHEDVNDAEYTPTWICSDFVELEAIISEEEASSP